MIESADKLSAATGISYAGVAKNMKDVTQGALSMEMALKSASIGVSSGLSGKQMTQIAEVATKAANALGRSVPEAINRMTQAVVKNEPELVDEYGIILRVDAAMKDYADSIGKTKAELTSYDKQMSIHAQLVKQGEDKFAGVEGQANAYNKLGASFAEMSHGLLTFINDGLTPMVSLLAENRGLLAAIAAIFAKGVFAKALPELQNMTSSMAAQRDVMREQIADKTGDLDILAASEVEFSLSKKSDDYLENEFKKQLKGVDKKTLTEHFGDDVGSLLADSTASGYKDAWEYVDLGSVEVKGLVSEMDAVKTAAAEGDKEAQNFLATQNKTVTTASKLVSSQQLYTGEIKRSSVGIDEENGKLAQTQKWLQRKTLELEKQRLIMKDARSAAFVAGSTGGFLGGGLAKANEQINSLGTGLTTFGKIGIRTAGIMGNIAGFAGSVMSLVSGWGIALFVVANLIEPIANMFGLTNKEATAANEAIKESNKSLIKMQKDAEKIQDKEIKDIASALNQSTASANNLNGQIDEIITSLDKLATAKFMNPLDKLLSWDFGSFEEKVDAAASKIQNFYDLLGGGAPDNLKAKVSDYTVSKNNLDLIREELKVRRDATEQAKKNKDLLIIGDKSRLMLLNVIATSASDIEEIEKRITDALGEQRKAQKAITHEAELTLDLRNKEKDAITAAKDAIKDLASLKTKSANKLASATPYYDELKNVNKLQEQLKYLTEQEETDKKKIQAIVDDYNLSTKENIKDEIELNGVLQDRKGILDANVIQYAKQLTATKEIALSLKDAEDRRGKGSSKGISDTYNLKREQTLSKIKEINFKIEQDQLDLNKLSNSNAKKSGDYKSKVLLLEEAIKQKQLDINILTKESQIQNSKLNESIEIGNASLKVRSDILKANNDIISSKLVVASDKAKSGGTSELNAQFALKEAEYQGKINTLKLESKQLANDAQGNMQKTNALGKQQLAIAEKIKTLVYQKNQEIGKTAKLSAIVNKAMDLGIANLDKEIAQIDEDTAAIIIDVIPRATNANILYGLQERQQNIELKHYKTIQKLDLKRRKIEVAHTNGITDDLEKQKDLAKNDLEVATATAAIELQRLEYAEERFELLKKTTAAIDIFRDPKGFTNILGEEFDRIAEDFSESMMDPVTRMGDSMLRIMDTATDTLYDAVVAGENVGDAIWTAVRDVSNEIASEISKDIMKQWSRDLLSNLFSVESVQDKQLTVQENILTELQSQCGKVPTKTKVPKSPLDNIKKIFGDISTKIKEFFGFAAEEKYSVDTKATETAHMVGMDIDTSNLEDIGNTTLDIQTILDVDNNIIEEIQGQEILISTSIDKSDFEILNTPQTIIAEAELSVDAIQKQLNTGVTLPVEVEETAFSLFEQKREIDAEVKDFSIDPKNKFGEMYTVLANIDTDMSKVEEVSKTTLDIPTKLNINEDILSELFGKTYILKAILELDTTELYNITSKTHVLQGTVDIKEPEATKDLVYKAKVEVEKTKPINVPLIPQLRDIDDKLDKDWVAVVSAKLNTDKVTNEIATIEEDALALDAVINFNEDKIKTTFDKIWDIKYNLVDQSLTGDTAAMQQATPILQQPTDIVSDKTAETVNTQTDAMTKIGLDAAMLSKSAIETNTSDLYRSTEATNAVANLNSGLLTTNLNTNHMTERQLILQQNGFLQQIVANTANAGDCCDSGTVGDFTLGEEDPMAMGFSSMSDAQYDGTSVLNEGIGGTTSSVDHGTQSAHTDSITSNSIATNGWAQNASGLASVVSALASGNTESAIGGIVQMGISAWAGGGLSFEDGGITNSLNRYATGGVTSGPEMALIGDNASGKEAVVPLPSGEQIPVEFTGESQEKPIVINNNITVTGSDNPEALRRSAAQVAQAVGLSTQRAMARNG